MKPESAWLSCENCASLVPLEPRNAAAATCRNPGKADGNAYCRSGYAIKLGRKCLDWHLLTPGPRWHMDCSSFSGSQMTAPRCTRAEGKKATSMKRGAREHHAGQDAAHAFRAFQAIVIMCLCWGSLFAPARARAADLSKGTLVDWDAYVDNARPQVNSQATFLWVDQEPERLRRVRQGEILVSPVGKENPKPIDSGLIHDWRGAAFLPDTKVEDVFAAVRDYDSYKNYYKPTVVDSKLLSTKGPCETYSMRVVNKEAVAETALDMEYETCYFKVDENRWYSITNTTRIQEIRHYGRADERELPPDHGSGSIWRLYGVARYEQRDGGTYVEVEAIALSRDIPGALRWFVNPIVRRVSRNSLLLSLQETNDAVRSVEAVNRDVNSVKTAANLSQKLSGAKPSNGTTFIAPVAKP